MTTPAQGSLSARNMKLWNRAGLVMTNGTVTMSVAALGLILDWARADAEPIKSDGPRGVGGEG